MSNIVNYSPWYANGYKAGSALKKAPTVLKSGLQKINLGNVPIKSTVGALVGLDVLNGIGQASANARAEDPTVQADWERYKNSNYLDPSAMPNIHDDYLSEDARQAIMQMAPAAKALNFRQNQLDLLNGLANVAEEERAMQNATESLLANASNNVANIINDSRDPGTQTYLAIQGKKTKSKTQTDGSYGTGGTGGSSNELDPLMGLLGLLALGGGAFYLGKKL